MKKFTLIVTAVALTALLNACGRTEPMPTTIPSIPKETRTETKPTIDPTMGTNIPDPSVNSTMPSVPEHTESTTRK